MRTQADFKQAVVVALAVALNASFGMAQQPAPPATSPLGYRISHDRLYLSPQPHGSPQVRGRAYKAEFRAAGATYIPFCGSQAPANHPLTLRIASITAGGEPVAFADSVVAGLDGTTVRYARGGVTEVYELALDSVEQEFVFDELPASGELVLQLAFTSDMQAAREGGAIRFSSADGGVLYGAATVVDAKGACAAVRSELSGETIELHVPADFLATAAFPVTIDPVLATFTVGPTPEPVDSFAPAIAWDETTAHWCVTFEEVFSTLDHDVTFELLGPNGTYFLANYFDTILGDYYAAPDVANNNFADQFLIVCQFGLPGSPFQLREIHARTLAAGSGLMGADFLVSTADQTGEKINASVGGDPRLTSSSYYCVVWQRILTADVNEDIHGRAVTTAGGLLGTGTILIDNGSALDRRPRISKSCQLANHHHVVWERWHLPPAVDRDIWGAELSSNGSITIGSSLITAGYALGTDTTSPACSPVDNSGRWMVVYEFDWGTDDDIHGYLLTGLTIISGAVTNLTLLESNLGSGMLFQDQRHPAVETDGSHFAFSYSEQHGTSTTDYDIYVSTIDIVGGVPVLSEFHRNLAQSTSREDFPRMCSQQESGGASNRMGIVWWDNNPVSQGNIEGCIYGTSDFLKLCFPNHDGVANCPCANNPTSIGRGCNNSSATGGASLDGTGESSLGADTATFHTSGEKPTAVSIVMQGTSLIPAGTTFGQGLRCAGGTQKRLYTKIAVGGAITAPEAGDPSIHVRSAALGDPLSAGNLRWYYVYYRDGTVLGGCPTGATFNTTDTVQVLWRL